MDTIPQDNTPRKQCSNPTCQKWLPATTEFFYAAKVNKDGLSGQCKECVKQKVNARYQMPETKERKKEYSQRPEVKARERDAKPERYQQEPEFRDKLRERSRLHYHKPEVRQKVLEYSRLPEVRARHLERERKQWQHPEYRAKRLIYGKIYRQRPDVKLRLLEYHRKYQPEYLRRPGMRLKKRAYERNRYLRPDVRAKKLAYDRIRHHEYNRRPDVRDKRREYMRVYAHLRRANHKAVAGVHTHAQIQEQLKRQHYRCYYAACNHAKFERRQGKYIYHIEHTFPISRVAGTDIPANDMSYLVLACPSCNQSKGNKFPWEWPEGGRLL